MTVFTICRAFYQAKMPKRKASLPVFTTPYKPPKRRKMWLSDSFLSFLDVLSYVRYISCPCCIAEATCNSLSQHQQQEQQHGYEYNAVEEGTVFRYENEIQEQRERYEKKLGEAEARYQKKLSEVQSRLSQEISSRVATDSTLEDVSEKNRPLSLRDTYEQIRSNQWLEATEALQRAIGGGEDDPIINEHVHKFLCAVFMSSYSVMERKRDDSLAFVISPMEGTVSKPPSSKRGSGKSPCDAFTVSIYGKWLSRADKIGVDKTVAEEVVRDIYTHDASLQRFFAQKNLLPLELSDVLELVKDACRLSWAMVLNTPPLTFASRGVGRAFDEVTQKVYYTCDPRRPVKYYLFPAMYHEGALLDQGQVFTE